MNTCTDVPLLLGGRLHNEVISKFREQVFNSEPVFENLLAVWSWARNEGNKDQNNTVHFLPWKNSQFREGDGCLRPVPWQVKRQRDAVPFSVSLPADALHFLIILPSLPLSACSFNVLFFSVLFLPFLVSLFSAPPEQPHFFSQL